MTGGLMLGFPCLFQPLALLLLASPLHFRSPRGQIQVWPRSAACVVPSLKTCEPSKTARVAAVS